MGKHNRDNFSTSVVRSLRENVANFCSNPACRALTIGPNESPNKTTIVGTAAHITAASLGGPRYDSTLSSEQRKSYDNGIWLCNVHARQIDVDPDRFTTSLLKSWKSDAEEFARKHTGERLLPEKELNQKAMQFALAMMSESSEEGFALSNFSEAIGAHDRELESLDPRFRVQTSLAENKQTTTISPKDTPVEVSIRLPSDSKHQLIEKLHNGQACSIDSGEFQLSGSPLLEQVAAQMGTLGQLTLTPNKYPLDIRMSTIDGNGIQSTVGEYTGHFCITDNHLFIETQLFRGLITLKYKARKNEKANINYNVNIFAWQGFSVSKLPYFPRLQKLIPVLQNGGDILFEFALPGEEYRPLCSTINRPELQKVQDFLLDWLLHFETVRYINKAFALSLIANINDASYADFDRLEFFKALLKGPVIIDKYVFGTDSIRLEMKTQQNNKSLLSSFDKDIRLVAQKSQISSIMGQNVQLPRTQIELINVDSHLVSQNDDMYIIDIRLNEKSYGRWSLLSDEQQTKEEHVSHSS